MSLTAISMLMDNPECYVCGETRHPVLWFDRYDNRKRTDKVPVCRSCVDDEVQDIIKSAYKARRRGEWPDGVY